MLSLLTADYKQLSFSSLSAVRISSAIYTCKIASPGTIFLFTVTHLDWAKFLKNS